MIKTATKPIPLSAFGKQLIEQEILLLKAEFPNEAPPISSAYRLAIYASLIKISMALDQEIEQILNGVTSTPGELLRPELENLKDELEQAFVRRTIEAG